MVPILRPLPNPLRCGVSAGALPVPPQLPAQGMCWMHEHVKESTGGGRGRRAKTISADLPQSPCSGAWSPISSSWARRPMALLINFPFLPKTQPHLFQITTSSPDTSILEILNFLLDHFFLYLLICVQHKALSLQGLHRHQRGPKKQPPPEGGVPGDSESGWRQQQRGPPGNSAGMGGRHVVACRAQEEKTNSLSLWCPPLTIPQDLCLLWGHPVFYTNFSSSRWLCMETVCSWMYSPPIAI